MLKSWTLENFKSVGRRVDLELAPLTIFAGANSSGKSTFLHSILLLKQTVQYAPSNRPLALNGPILKLGRYDDVFHDQPDSANIRIGFHLNLSSYYNLQSQTGLRTLNAPIFYAMRGIQSIKYEAGFDVADQENELSQLQPQMNFLNLTLIPEVELFSEEVEDQDGNISEQIYESQPQNTELNLVINDAESTLDTTRESTDDELSANPKPAYRVVKIDNILNQELQEGLENPTITGAFASHFTPSSFELYYDKAKTEATKAAELICALSPAHRITSQGEEIRIPGTIISQILLFLENQLQIIYNQDQSPISFRRSIDEEKRYSIHEVIYLINSSIIQHDFASYDLPGLQLPSRRIPQSNRIQKQVRLALQDYQHTLANKILDTIQSGYDTKRATNERIRHTNLLIKHYFSSTVKYLGPLRDEPRPLYPLEALANPLDVGYRGEHTAAVLELNRERTVTYIDPGRIERDGPLVKVQQASLHDAAIVWLSYLGVAEDVATSDKGKFGHEMQVRAAGVKKSHDLTNVGVGVSQVLPIIIMSLLSDDDSVLIFEQPELHLHPLVQSRLADFLICLALQGKQCLIETHSEYLIKRIRRRTAEFEGSTLSQKTKIYFVERERGESSYQPIELNSFGTTSEWPKDFFDQSDRETERIIAAATAKRLKNRELK